jgi:hypothetical protein
MGISQRRNIMLDLFNKKLVLKEGSINDAKAHIKKII